MTVTPLYAGLIALLLVLLSWRVIAVRQSGGVNLGDGGNPMLERRIRAQANLAEYAPVALILIGLIEYAGYSGWLVHLLGIALVVGRALHGWALSFTKSNSFGRISGMVLTLIVITVAALMNLAIWFQGAAAG